MRGGERERRADVRRDAVGSTTYEIHVAGHLDPGWVDGFDGHAVAWTETGESIVTAVVPDQAALQGLLSNVFGLGLPLHAVVKRNTVVDGSLTRAWRATTELLRFAVFGSDALLLRADRREGRLVCHYASADGMELVADLDGAPAFPDDVTWRAYSTGDVAAGSRPTEAGAPRCAIVALPLLAAGDVVGVLRVTCTHAAAYTEAQLAALRAAAHLLATALENDTSRRST